MSNSISVKIKKMHPLAKMPAYAHNGDAGLDLSVTSIENLGAEKVKFGLGVAIELPEGHVGLLFPRSSVHKSTLRLSNSVGVLDSNFQGEITAVFDRLELEALFKNEYDIGDRIIQLVILPFPKVEFEQVTEFTSKSERGTGSYGSSGA